MRSNFNLAFRAMLLKALDFIRLAKLNAVASHGPKGTEDQPRK